MRKANQLIGFYMVRVFIEKHFRIGYKYTRFGILELRNRVTKPSYAK